MLYFSNDKKSNEWLSLGVKDLNTDKFFYRAGGKDFGTASNFVLSMPFGMERDVCVIHGDRNRNENKIKKYALKHKSLWEGRTVI